MSRFEGEFNAADEAGIDLVELLAGLASGAARDPGRWEAMACFLSAGQGWRDAAATLGGTFAETVANGSGLTGGKEE